jgi:hypothetical protein
MAFPQPGNFECGAASQAAAGSQPASCDLARRTRRPGALPPSCSNEAGLPPISTARLRRSRGSTAMEFALVAIAAIPMFFGTVSVGITLGRSIQSMQVTRDAGHMYGLGVDFSTPGAQGIMNKIAEDFDLSANGSAVLIFSQITTVYQADCNAAGLGAQCGNAGSQVFVQRLTMGNTALRSSNFGTPPANYIGAKGNIAQSNYFQQTTLRANGFGAILTQNQGDVAYVVEGFFKQPDLAFLSPGFSQNNQGTYVRVIF